MTNITPTLIQRCRQRDQRAQSELYRLCYGFLMPVCYRYASSDDDPMEFLNVGFYKVLANLKKYKSNIPFEAWSKRVVINAILDELRKKKRYRSHVRSSEELTGNSGDESFVLSEIDQETSAEEIYEDIRELPNTTGSVFNLYAIDGYKHKEIAKKLGISEGTSKWHYSEARKRLKAKIIRRRARKDQSENETEPTHSSESNGDEGQQSFRIIPSR